nr:MAG TPA: hypothetical protein [Bacteriophage sp.]
MVLLHSQEVINSCLLLRLQLILYRILHQPLLQ